MVFSMNCAKERSSLLKKLDYFLDNGWLVGGLPNEDGGFVGNEIPIDSYGRVFPDGLKRSVMIQKLEYNPIVDTSSLPPIPGFGGLEMGWFVTIATIEGNRLDVEIDKKSFATYGDAFSSALYYMDKIEQRYLIKKLVGILSR